MKIDLLTREIFFLRFLQNLDNHIVFIAARITTGVYGLKNEMNKA